MFYLNRANELPKYEIIHQESNGYKNMKWGEVEDRLSANNFRKAKRTDMIANAIFAIGMGIIFIVVGGSICLGLMGAGVTSPINIVGGVCGGLAIASLCVAGCAGIIHLYRRQQKLSDKEFDQLMEEIHRAKSNDMKRLKRSLEEGTTPVHSYQTLLSQYENLEFKTTQD